MKEKELMIGIPTKDHPKYIQYLLARVLPIAQKHNISVGIYDSSAGYDTSRIVQERVTQGYSNLFYKRYPADIFIEDKLKYILINSGFAYVWLCGDGVIVNLEDDISIIEQEIKKSRDIICFEKATEAHEYKEFSDPVKFLKECFAPMTFYGNSIVKGNLMNVDFWQKCKDKYMEQIIPACYYELMAQKKLNTVFIQHSYYEANPYKLTSSWMKIGRCIEAFAGIMTNTVESLPETYHPVKKEVLKAVDTYTGVFSLSHLWTLRANGNLTAQIVHRYRKNIKKTSSVPIGFFYLIAFCNKRIATMIAVILDNVW